MSYPPPNPQYYPPPQGGYPPGSHYSGAPPQAPPPNQHHQSWGPQGPYQQPLPNFPGPQQYNAHAFQQNAQVQYPPPGPGYPPGGHGPPPGGYPQHGTPQQYGHAGPYPPPHSPQPPQHPQSFPPHQPGYGPQPGQGYQQQHGGPYQPPQPSLGYGVNHVANADSRREADALRKAMKGFGTDEKALIQILAKLAPDQIAAVRATYSSHIKRDLYSDVKSETSGYFKQGLLAIIDGPLLHDTALAREAVQGIGTKEWLLDDVLVGRSNADLNAIKASYDRTYRRSLERDVEGDLSFKTKTLYSHVLSAQRNEENAYVDENRMETYATSIHNATAARVMNNADEISSILPRLSNNEIRVLSHKFQARYRTSLESHIEKEFSGHMKDALLHMIRGAIDPASRDAVALEECMKGMGTKDEKLVIRVVRAHWNRQHLDKIKRVYQTKYKTDLVKRVKGETSGDYQRLLVAMLE
ncbi:annexin [Aspergillus undulatus]|uniref:annexin n=1 Tax=Aspergillus undulatus TaxID=1810928 RepID=UPI003CCC9026